MKEDVMENELPPDDLRNIWQNQSVEVNQMSLDQLRRKAEKFQKRIHNRNFTEYAAAVFVVAAFVRSWRVPQLRLGSGLIIAATLYMVYQLHKRGAAKTVPAALGLGTCRDFHRQELERQRDLLRDIWKWYLLPFVPGLLAFVAVPAMQVPPDKWLRMAPFILMCAVVFFGIGRLNQRAAVRLQRQIDELDTIAGAGS
jgi:lipopolysaccharide export LptBFGC system permease protein LptF